MSSDNFFNEIQDEFLQEASDLLSRVEALSLELEKDSESQETFGELARLAHNFKGSGKAVGFDHISKLGHRLEDFILSIKNKVISATPYQLDFLFKCLDHLKSDIEILILNKSAQLNHDDIFKEIDRRLSASGSSVDGVNSDFSDKSLAGNQSEITNESSQTTAIDLATPSPIEAEEVPREIHSVVTENTKVKKQSGASVSTVNEVLRIQKSKIDFILEAFGEQVILQSALEQHKFNLEENKDLIQKTITQLTKLTFELQDHALSLTMIQLGPLYTKLERAIRDASRVCGKSIEIELCGANTEVDKTLIDSLSDSLTHIVRNAVDHAIETSEVRLQKGKPEKGNVRINSKRQGGQLWIEVSDDGKGLNPRVIKEKAIMKGILSQSQAEKMTDQESYQLIFANGFSTKDVVSEVSGRGVGVNVVAEAISLLKGTIEIESQIDRGTTFRLKLPLSLAIFNGAVIKVNDGHFVIPNSEISEIGKINNQEGVSLDADHSVIKIRDEIFQLIDLRKKLKPSKLSLVSSNNTNVDKKELPVLLSRKNKKCAFLVDEIVGMQKIVQKPLGDEIRSRQEYAAATILSDGSAGLILNLLQFVENI